MKKPIKTILITTFLAVPIFLATTTPSMAGGVVLRSSAEKEGFLTMVCADFNMLTRQGQRYCLQEMYGQSLEFAKSFFAAMDFNASNKMQRIRQWREKAGLNNPTDLTEEQKTKAQTDVTYLIGYGVTCQQLSDTILNPEQLLGLDSKTVETLVGLPEYCVEQAIDVARRFDLAIDFTEATHLSENIGRVRVYYETRPDIPKPRAGEEIRLPDSV